MGEPEMAEIAALIGLALRERTDEGVLETVRHSVRALCDRFPPYPGLSGLGAGPVGAAGGRGS